MASVVVALAVFVGSAARVLPTLLAVPIQHNLGWQTSDVAWPITLGIAVSALAAPLAAHGLERSGVRSSLFASLVLLAASLASTTFATAPWHLVVAWGLGLGFSGSLSASILAVTIGSRDEAAHCGTRFGLLASMQFLGSAAGLLAASRAADAAGWRDVFHVAAAAALTTAFASIAFVRTGTGAAPRRPASGRGGCPRAMGTNRRLWVFAAIFFICGASTSGLIDGGLGILCMGTGLGLPSSADVLVIAVLGSAAGSAASGFLADRYPSRILLALYFAARAIALIWLPFTGLSVVELSRFGAFYGVDAALTFPALVRLMPANLGHRNLSATMGWMSVAHVAGAVITSASVGYLGLAAYAVGFAVVGLVCLLAAGLVLLLKDAPRETAGSNR
ncbi:MAG: MFS transporter [Xanthobacteraceae bacterium]|nr:MFS transporter [Xanthobacteraceae bacterium]